ncbi:hypothetical protein DEO72_LG3g939 [Vigna unguiculata]|uniref:Uncharacterized protein n=1 Tax=Vigna unguiculata TaxID=3917 RepID=A0A4D6LCW1_VIGUN|nr:hypothetical protein DEO72_LG3g939 [Vigna unguiculata]
MRFAEAVYLGMVGTSASQSLGKNFPVLRKEVTYRLIVVGFCIWVRWKLVSDCQEVLLVTVRVEEARVWYLSPTSVICSYVVFFSWFYSDESDASYGSLREEWMERERESIFESDSLRIVRRELTKEKRESGKGTRVLVWTRVKGSSSRIQGKAPIFKSKRGNQNENRVSGIFPETAKRVARDCQATHAPNPISGKLELTANKALDVTSRQIVEVLERLPPRGSGKWIVCCYLTDDLGRDACGVMAHYAKKVGALDDLFAKIRDQLAASVKGEGSLKAANLAGPVVESVRPPAQKRLTVSKMKGVGKDKKRLRALAKIGGVAPSGSNNPDLGGFEKAKGFEKALRQVEFLHQEVSVTDCRFNVNLDIYDNKMLDVAEISRLKALVEEELANAEDEGTLVTTPPMNVGGDNVSNKEVTEEEAKVADEDGDGREDGE